MRCVALLGHLAWVLQSVSGQTGVAIISSDHNVLPLLRTSPGQVTSLRLTGIPPLGRTPIRPASLPATELAGISILLGRPGLPEVPMRPIPILAVEQISECQGETRPDCLSTVVTTQVPYGFGPDSIRPWSLTSLGLHWPSDILARWVRPSGLR